MQMCIRDRYFDMELPAAFSQRIKSTPLTAKAVSYTHLVMDFGYRLWALRVTRSQQAGYGTLLEGFGIAGRVIAMNLLILLFTFLWSLLLIFVTTILAFFVLDSLFLQLLVMAGIYAAVFAIMLRYAMAPYLLADYPDDGAGAAVRRSVETVSYTHLDVYKRQLPHRLQAQCFLVEGQALVQIQDARCV